MFKLKLQLHAGDRQSFNEAVLSVKKKGEVDYTDLELLLEIPEIGGDPEKIDVTTLTDKVKKSIRGIGDPGDLPFVFLYDASTATSNYRVLKAIETSGEVASFKLMYPDGSGHEFDAEVGVKIGGGGVNAAKTFTASMFLQSDITDIYPGA